jgi:hypothetical protein
MLRIALLILFVGYVPGALIFRLPWGGVADRARLPAEERIFWSIVLSVIVAGVITMSLAAAGAYRLEWLLWILGAASVLLLVIGRTGLRLGPAPWPTWTAIPPIALAALTWYVAAFVPPSEYVMGGKDPGVYLNEGIQIAQRGSLTISDPLVSAVPELYRDLLFPDHRNPSYYSNRFMGFFLLDPNSGTVVGQFPHLYPSSAAVAYGIHGLSGARWVLVWWSVLGVLAVYFLGVRLFGRPAAAAGAGLLAVHVVQVWYARYPNAELVLQPLLFAGTLAYVRAQSDEIAFFRPVSAILFVLGIVTHLTAVFAVAAIVGTALLGRSAGQRLRASFAVPLVVGTLIALSYYVSYLPAYFAISTTFVDRLSPANLVLLGFGGVVLMTLWWSSMQPAVARVICRTIPVAVVAALWIAAGYAYFLRAPAGALAPQDAYALRMFTEFYLLPLGLALALAGLLVASRSFWTAAPFLWLTAVFALMFFYKIRVIPEHFWAARRFLAVVIPASLVLAGAAAFAPISFNPAGPLRALNARSVQWARFALGAVLVAILARSFVAATLPILRHVEYAGLIPRLEQLAARTRRTLTCWRSRSPTSTHGMSSCWPPPTLTKMLSADCCPGRTSTTAGCSSLAVEAPSSSRARWLSIPWRESDSRFRSTSRIGTPIRLARSSRSSTSESTNCLKCRGNRVRST